MDYNLRPTVSNSRLAIEIASNSPIASIYLLDLVQKSLDILCLFQVRLEDGWRGSTRETLPDHQDSRMLESRKQLASKKASGSRNENRGSHFFRIEREGVKALW
jgi:hypothetical protein